MIPVNDFDPKRNSSVLLMGTSTARMVGCAIDAGAGSAARLGAGRTSHRRPGSRPVIFIV